VYFICDPARRCCRKKKYFNRHLEEILPNPLRNTVGSKLDIRLFSKPNFAKLGDRSRRKPSTLASLDFWLVQRSGWLSRSHSRKRFESLRAVNMNEISSTSFFPCLPQITLSPSTHSVCCFRGWLVCFSYRIVVG
jgi:hypothetical protein